MGRDISVSVLWVGALLVAASLPHAQEHYAMAACVTVDPRAQSERRSFSTVALMADYATHGSVHLLPKPPTRAGVINETAKLSADGQYVIDGRVSTLKIAFDWEAKNVDVDASVAVFDDQFNRVDVVWWDKKTSKYCSVHHLGDERTGEKKGDKEVIEVELARVPLNVHYIFFTESVYTKGKSLEDAKLGNVKLLYPNKPTSTLEIATHAPGDQKGTNAVVVGLLTRKGAWWTFTALSKPVRGRTIKEIEYYTDFKAFVREPSSPAKTWLVKVWVPEARNIAASDKESTFGKNKTSDCFVHIACKDRKYTSAVVEKTLNPKWATKKLDLGETIESDHTLVEIKVLDQDPSNDDDFLGAAYLALGGMAKAGVGAHEVVVALGESLDPKEKVKRGVEISGDVVIRWEVATSEEE
eukprot:evm.model.scf_192EXC.9 EVM.evm.TU.scf_192EXC.9   scf_192EXC:102158-106558(+)